MKQTVENPDGIYPRVKYTANVKDPEEIKAVFAAMQTPSVAETIRQMEEHAMTRVSPRFHLSWAEKKRQAEEEQAEQGKVKRATDAEEDASEVVAYCGALRWAIADGKTTAAAGIGIYLGGAYERMMVRPHEPDAIRGKRVQVGSTAGSLARKKQGTRDIFLRNVKAGIENRGNRKQPSNTTLVKQAAKESGIQERQAWRYWKECPEKK